MKKALSLQTLVALLLGAILTPARVSASDAPATVPDRLDLKTAVELALENNFPIREARERIRQQEGVILEVSSRTIPNVAASGAYTALDHSLATANNPSDRVFTMQVQASQVLYAGGGVIASTKNARLAKEAAELDFKGVINEQLLAVRTQFYTVLLDQKKVGVQEENVKLLEEQLKIAQDRFNAGATSNFEVLQAQVALANGRPDLITARNDFRLDVEQLRQLLGFPEGNGNPQSKIPEFDGTLKVGDQATFDLRDALASARSNRPELQRLLKLQAAGEQQVLIARAGARPQLSAFGGYQWENATGPNNFAYRPNGWTAGLQGQWNIFDGRATAGRVAQSKSVLMQTNLAIDETTLSIDVEVRRAHSSLTEAWELVDASAKTVDQAEEALRLANVRYAAGTATQLDVLTSQVELTRARLNQLQAFYSYNVALATMRKAIGLADSYVQA
ncbi:MAG: TolC family protein [Opitutales bacterium]